MKSYLQFSLRELLAVVLCLGVGLAALKLGGLAASLVILGALLLSAAMTIVALVGRDAPRAMAIGFVVPIAAYGLLLYTSGSSELYPSAGRLATSRLLTAVYEVSHADSLVAPTPQTTLATSSIFITNGGGSMGGGPPAQALTIAPAMNTFWMPGVADDAQTAFMSVGHLLLALVFGYVGAKFAVAVHRTQHQSKAASPASPPPADNPA